MAACSAPKRVRFAAEPARAGGGAADGAVAAAARELEFLLGAHAAGAPSARAAAALAWAAARHARRAIAAHPLPISPATQLALRMAALLHAAAADAEAVCRGAIAAAGWDGDADAVAAAMLEMIAYVRVAGIPERARADPRWLWPRWCVNLAGRPGFVAAAGKNVPFAEWAAGDPDNVGSAYIAAVAAQMAGPA